MENSETTINKLIDIVNNAKRGDYSGRISVHSEDLLGLLSQKINDLMSTLERLTQNLQLISEGDISQHVEGQIGLAAVIKTLEADLRHFIWQAKAVADGDLSQKILYLGELGNAFNKMTENLKKSRDQIESYSERLEEKVAERTKELQRSLKEKEMLLREIHHRVKNNMQVISSLLRLQSRAIEDKEGIEIFKESQNRIKSMALVHEKIYHSKDLSGIDFADYIRELANGLVRFYGVDADRIALKFDVKNVSLGINSAISCGLLINELLSNSLKYAFPEGKSGEIRVFLRTTGENDIKLKVSDNGVGLPEDLDFRKSQSLGMQLVTTLVEYQLQGKIELNRNGGTEFKITFERTHATKAKPPELSFPPETVCAPAGHR